MNFPPCYRKKRKSLSFKQDQSQRYKNNIYDVYIIMLYVYNINLYNLNHVIKKNHIINMLYYNY